MCCCIKEAEGGQNDRSEVRRTVRRQDLVAKR